jgi:ribose transport system substrate-binding protein
MRTRLTQPFTRLLTAGLLTAALLSACGNSGSSTETTAETTAVAADTTAVAADTTPSDTKLSSGGAIGVSIPLLTTDFWRVFSASAEAEIKARGINALEIVNAGGDAAQQLADIDALVSQGAKGIIVSPVDSGAITAKLTELAAKGIKVVVVNDGVSAPVEIVVRANNLDYGILACTAMSKVITKGSIIHIAGDPTNVAAQERAKGFDDCMKEKAPNVKMVRIDAAGWAASEVANALPALLDSTPDVAGVYMHAGGAFLDPTLVALKAKGLLKPAGSPGHIVIATIDGIKIEFEAVRDGNADFVIAQPVDLYGKYGVDYLEKALSGTKLVEGPTDHGTKIVRDSAGNLQDALQPVLVSTDNVKDFLK